jgi:hypothetical protein
MWLRSVFLIGAATLALAACGSQQRDVVPSTAMAEPAPPAATPAIPPGAPPLPADLLDIGSQEAREALYCSALIYQENPDLSDALAPVDEALLRKAQTLGFVIGEYGINKLVAEKAAHARHARAISDAYAAQVEKDSKAGKPRMSLADCNKRAAAIPIPE